MLLGFLEPQVRRRVRHALFQGFLDVGEMPFQHLSNRVDTLVVTRLKLLAHARPQAISDVVFQAYPKLSLGNVFFGQGQAARADGVQRFAECQDGMHRLHVGVRPKVFGPVLAHLASREDSWESFVFDDNEGVRLVVFELDVVDRLVLLDHVVLQQQGVGLACSHNPLHIPNLLHQQPRLAVMVLLGEVAGDALLEVFGLADVQQFSVPIDVLIDARFLGHPIEDRLDVVGGRHR